MMGDVKCILLENGSLESYLLPVARSRQVEVGPLRRGRVEASQQPLAPLPLPHGAGQLQGLGQHLPVYAYHMTVVEVVVQKEEGRGQLCLMKEGFRHALNFNASIWGQREKMMKETICNF